MSAALRFGLAIAWRPEDEAGRDGGGSGVLGDGRALDRAQLVHGRMGGGEAKSRGKGLEDTRGRPEAPAEGDRVLVLLGRQRILLVVEAVSDVHASGPSLALASSLAPQGTSGPLGGSGKTGLSLTNEDGEVKFNLARTGVIRQKGDMLSEEYSLLDSPQERPGEQSWVVSLGILPEGIRTHRRYVLVHRSLFAPGGGLRQVGLAIRLDGM